MTLYHIHFSLQLHLWKKTLRADTGEQEALYKETAAGKTLADREKGSKISWGSEHICAFLQHSLTQLEDWRG